MSSAEPVLVADAITELLNRLKKGPSQLDTDTAAEMLSRAGALGRESDLEAELRRLLDDGTWREMILRSLARYAVLELDVDLSAQMPEPTITVIPTAFDLLLSAAAKSGSGMTADTLEILATTPSPVLFTVRISL